MGGKQEAIAKFEDCLLNCESVIENYAQMEINHHAHDGQMSDELIDAARYKAIL